MREALNSNPRVQAGVVAVLLVLVAFFFMTTMKKKDTGASTPPATPASPTASAGTTDGTTPASGADTASAAGATGGSALPAAPANVTPQALKPGPGLPAGVINAWKAGNAVVLLFVRPKGVDDGLVHDSVEALSGDSRLVVFSAPANRIARYSRITEPLSVNRVPALVVIRPRHLTGSTPEASVSYGFRNSQSVVQAVHDALYTGPDDLPYYPR